MKKPTRRQIEVAANAIRFLVPTDGSTQLAGAALAAWTEKGLREVKWPRSFGKDERKLIRAIARTVLSTRYH